MNGITGVLSTKDPYNWIFPEQQTNDRDY